MIKDRSLLAEAMEKLAKLEDAEDTNVLSRWIPISERLPKEEELSCYRSKTIQVWILDDMKKTERTISSTREMMKKPMRIMA